MQASSIFGGVPIGAVVSGSFAGNPNYLPCNGQEYLSASYPALDKTGLSNAFGSNVWTSRTLPASLIWTAVAFGNGVFVAVSNSSPFTTAASSADGKTWTARTIPSGQYYSVIFAAGLFVAIGASVCATSPDGVTWTARTGLGTAHKVSYGNGMFVASQDATNSTYWTSPDGVTWTARTGPWGAANFRHITFDGARFIASNNVTSSATFFTSVDGLNWILRTASNGNAAATAGPYGYAFSINGTLFIPLSQNTGLQKLGPADLQFTYDVYALPSNGPVAANLNGIAFQAATGSTTPSVFWSLNGTQWSSQPMPSTSNWGSAAASGGPGFAFGNNTWVCLQSNAQSTCASLDVETTRFRTPYLPDQPAYLKVA